MERVEFLKIAEAIKTAYPKENLIPNKAAMQLWFAMLKDLDYKAVQVAVKAYIATKRFPPTIADIRLMAQPPKTDWSDAWGEIERAIRQFGWARPKEALESMSPKTREIVKRFGWQEICTSENTGVLRGQFRAAYEAYTDTEQRKELTNGHTERIGGTAQHKADNEKRD